MTINLATSLLQTFIVLVTSLPSCCLPGKRVRSLPKEEAIDNSFSHEADRSYAHFFASFTAMTVTRCSTLNGKFSATHVYHQFPRRTRRVTTGVSRDGEKRGRNGEGKKKEKKNKTSKILGPLSPRTFDSSRSLRSSLSTPSSPRENQLPQFSIHVPLQSPRPIHHRSHLDA